MGYSVNVCLAAYNTLMLNCCFSGWLSWYQQGVFHRDISIGNIIRLDVPAPRRPFKVSSLEHLLKKFGSMKGLGDIDLLTLHHRNPHVRKYLQGIETWRSTLDKQVQELNVGVMCCAFLSDADCAADLWADYFEGLREETLRVRIACYSGGPRTNEHRVGYSAISVEGAGPRY